MPPPYRRQVFVCTNERPAGAPRPSCKPRGSEAVRNALKKALAARGLDAEIRANAAGCLDACEHGVSVVVYPEQVWYGGVTVDDVDDIVEEHLVRGRTVERLLMKLEAKPATKLPVR